MPLRLYDMTSQIAKFMGPTWGPPGSCRPQMGPMLAPWTLLSGTFQLVGRFLLLNVTTDSYHMYWCSTGFDVMLTCVASCLWGSKTDIDYIEVALSLWCLNKMATIFIYYFQMHFVERKLFRFDKIFTEVYFGGSNSQTVTISSGNALVPNRWQMITWIDDSSVQRCKYHQGPFLLTWIHKCIHYKMWDEITYEFPNFNDYTIEVREWISNFISHFIGHVITYPCWD